MPTYRRHLRRLVLLASLFIVRDLPWTEEKLRAIPP
jgi:hypothetical protein